MVEAVFAIPGDIELRTGGYTYDRRVLALLPRFGVTVTRKDATGAPVSSSTTLPRTRGLLTSGTFTPSAPASAGTLLFGWYPAARTCRR